MYVSVFGMGYVGLVTSACMARDGHTVIGVDVDQHKLELIRKGEVPISEAGLSGLMSLAQREQRFSVTDNVQEAIEKTEVSLVCVGTPSGPDGSQKLDYVLEASRQIAAAVKVTGKPHTVILRSTVLPGTTAQCAEVMHEVCPDVSIHCGYNPEFLREGCAIADYDAPPFVVIGSEEPRSESILRELYTSISAPMIQTDIATAETIKFVCNAWHATKVAFANEVGRISDAAGIDAREVMGIVCRDTKLNISSTYMRPGFAYGGSCLPKDVRGAVAYGNRMGVDLPLLSSLEVSNEAHVDWAVKDILKMGKTKIGMLGLAFKPGTDDVRESPALKLAKRLLDNGVALKIMDPCIQPSTISPSTKSYIEDGYAEVLPCIVGDSNDLAQHAELVVLTQGTNNVADVLSITEDDVPIMDLSRVFVHKPSD